MRRPNFYSGVGLDRVDHLRGDEAWLRARLEHASTRFVAVWRSRNLVAPGDAARPVWLKGADAAALIEQADSLTFLGRDAQRAYVAFDQIGRAHV
jgi:NADH pyrophosphatase NudC (nudix superfamily)